MKNIIIFGATGSIGRSTLDIIRAQKNRFKILGLTAKSQVKVLRKLAEEFKPNYLVIEKEADAEYLKRSLSYSPEILWGDEGLKELALLPSVDLVIIGISGIKGLIPTYYALKSGKKVAIANKESLIVAGKLLKKIAKENQGELIPVDSEHSALFQLLQKEEYSKIEKLYLTASGGPFYEMPINKFSKITPKMAINHPTWKMGAKISIDSATLMNKGFEVLEASVLFDFPIEKIKVLIHPQSIVHALIKLIDGSYLAHLSIPDMKIPISYALNFPERIKIPIKELELEEIGTLVFKKPDFQKFPCLKIAYEVGKMGDPYPLILEAADEVVVDAFMKKKITFDKIPFFIEKTLKDFKMDLKNFKNIEEILFLHKEICFFTQKLIEERY